MSKGTGSTVECPVCGEQFDPMAAGGWCTNPDCGEWRQEVDDRTGDEGSAETGASATGPESDEEAAEADSPASTADSEADTGESFTRGGSDPEHASGAESPSEDPDEPDGGADDSWGAFEPADSGADGEADGAAGDTTGEGVSETPDRETPVEGSGQAGAGDRDDAGSLPGTDEEDAEAGSDDVAADDAEPVEPTDDEEPETLTCPGCAAEVTAEAQFCPECGTDTSGPHDETGDEQPVCHDCGAEVAEDDSFCVSCGADLTDAEPEPERLTECPACDAPVDGDAGYCASCGEHLDPHRDGEEADDADTGAAAAEPAPEALTLSARGREVRVADGDAVGRQVRRIIMDTDGDEDKAVRIHREHVRFVREGGQFYVVDLGDNPTVVNDTHMEKGDRQLVGPGDELALSGVVTLSVGHP